jgi:hypothetical protein
LPFPGNANMFVTKVSSTWQYLWATYWWANNLNGAAWVATDNDWNVFVAWYFWADTGTFGSFNLSNSWRADIFVAKLSSSWQYLWAVKWWGDNADYVKWITTDNDWNIYIAWYFKGIVNFGNFNLLTTGWHTDIFVAKLSSTWQYLRAIKWWGTSDDQAYWVSTDGDWNIYVAWNFSWSASFGNFNLLSSGKNDVFLAKLSSTWQYLRALKWWGTGDDQAYWISTDNDWNIYVAWIFTWNTSFGSFNLSNSWQADIFATKFSSTWQYLRALKWWGDNADYVKWITTDNDWNIYVAWNFSWNASFGNFNLLSSGQNDAFVAKLSSTWQYLRALKWWGTGDDQTYWVSTDNDWNIYVGWAFKPPFATFWDISLYTNGYSYDVFLAKILSWTSNLFAINNGSGTTNSQYYLPYRCWYLMSRDSLW